MLLKQAEYIAATVSPSHQTIAFRSGLGPHKATKPPFSITSAGTPSTSFLASMGFTASPRQTRAAPTMARELPANV